MKTYIYLFAIITISSCAVHSTEINSYYKFSNRYILATGNEKYGIWFIDNSELVDSTYNAFLIFENPESFAIKNNCIVFKRKNKLCIVDTSKCKSINKMEYDPLELKFKNLNFNNSNPFVPKVNLAHCY
jgi:hypothetical protein